MKKIGKTNMTLWIVAIIVVIGIVVLLTTGSNNNSSPKTENTAPTGTTGTTETETSSNTPSSYNIEITNFAFSPETLSIKKGDKVTWTNLDSASHTVSSDGSTELSSQPLSQGKAYTHTFKISGTFSYHCAFHSGMKGKIIVA